MVGCFFLNDYRITIEDLQDIIIHELGIQPITSSSTTERQGVLKGARMPRGPRVRPRGSCEKPADKWQEWLNQVKHLALFCGKMCDTQLESTILWLRIQTQQCLSNVDQFLTNKHEQFHLQKGSILQKQWLLDGR